MALFLTEEEWSFAEMEGGQAFVGIGGIGIIVMQMLFVASWDILLKVSVVNSIPIWCA